MAFQKNMHFKQALGVPGEFYDNTSPQRVSAFKLKGATGASTYAVNVITFAANPLNGETVKIGTVTYAFKDTPAAAEDIRIGIDAAATLAYLINAVNGTGTAGVDYFTGTTSPNTAVRAEIDGSLGVKLTARTAGVSGNALVLTVTGGSLIIENATGTLNGGAAGVNINPTVARVFTQDTTDDSAVIMGGSGVIRGVLVSPKQYANYNNLRATMEVADGSPGDIAWMAHIVVVSAHAVKPDYIAIYNLTDGTIGANPGATGIPSGWAVIPKARYILYSAVAGGLAVLELDY